MAEDGKVIYKIEGDDSQALKAVEHFEKEAKSSGKNVEAVVKKSSKNAEEAVKKSSDKMRNSVVSASKKIATAIGSAFAVRKVLEFGKAAVDVASDLNEVQNVVDTTFGAEGAGRVNEWAKTAAEAFGESELQAKQFTSTIGAMFKSMGVGQKEMEDMSISLAGLAGDMASFYNLDPTEAFEKLRSGISGETEPLKQLGINMSVANLEAFALSEGITKAYTSMTQAEQATLRYKYIMSATADAQGDFAKTSDSFANQVRIMQLEIQTLAAEIGNGLMPIAMEVVGWGREAAGWLTEHAGAISDFAQKVMGAISPIVETLVPRAAELLEKIAPVLSPIAELLGIIASFIADRVASALDVVIPLIESAVEVFNGWVETVKGAYESMFNLANSVYESFEPAMGVFTEILDGVIGLFGSVIGLVEDIINSFVDWGSETGGLGEAIMGLVELFNNTFGPVLETVGGAIKWVIDLLESAVEKIRDFLQWLGVLEQDKPALNRASVTQQDIIKNGAYHMEYDKDENGAPTNGHMVVDWDKAEQMNQDGTWVGGGQVSFSGTGGRRHQSGEDFVMADWTPAYLDYGERVLTASENARYTAMGGVDGMERAAGGEVVSSGGFRDSGPQYQTVVLKVNEETLGRVTYRLNRQQTQNVGIRITGEKT